MKTEYIKPAVNFVIRPADDLCFSFGESTFQTSEDDEKIDIKPGVPDDDDWVSAKKYWAWDDEEDVIETDDDSSLF